MAELPDTLYTAEQSRLLDRVAMEEAGLGGGALMERAGAAAFACLRREWPRARRPAILCGPGNNGGDGYVVARLAAAAGLEPRVIALKPAASEDARRAEAAWRGAGGGVEPWRPDLLDDADVVVDALFGTGLERPLEGDWAAAVAAANRAPVPVLAVDAPSGLHSDSGRVLGECVQADVTLTFICVKQGLLTGAGPHYCGRLFFDDLDVPGWIYARAGPGVERLSAAGLRHLVPRRPRHAHKGDCGRVVIAGGAAAMPGAARLAGEGALRAGAGLVSLAVHPAHGAAMVAGRPELILNGGSVLSGADAVAVGPGLGREDWGRDLWERVMDAGVPKVVVDADALYHLARAPARRDTWVLTPHPGEAARLLETTVDQVEADRVGACRRLARRYGGVCVLKGAGTVIAAAGGSTALCDAGNPGLASGGTGDVLTGIIAALLAQGLSPWNAACLGVWLHASAADRAVAEFGEAGLLAGDLPRYVGRLMDELCAS